MTFLKAKNILRLIYDMLLYDIIKQYWLEKVQYQNGQEKKVFSVSNIFNWQSLAGNRSHSLVTEHWCFLDLGTISITEFMDPNKYDT